MCDKAKNRIGIFGGTFDPFTLAHKCIVDKVLLDNFVDHVVIVPTIVDYHRQGKKKWLDFNSKIDVIYAFLKDDVFYLNGQISISHIEHEFKLSHSESSCVDRRFVHTLGDIIKQKADAEAEYFTIIGTDSLANFKTWHRYEDILKMSKLIAVAGRKDVEFKNSELAADIVNIDDDLAGVSASEIRAQYEQFGMNEGVEHYIEDLLGKSAVSMQNYFITYAEHENSKYVANFKGKARTGREFLTMFLSSHPDISNIISFKQLS